MFTPWPSVAGYSRSHDVIGYPQRATELLAVSVSVLTRHFCLIKIIGECLGKTNHPSLFRTLYAIRKQHYLSVNQHQSSPLKHRLTMPRLTSFDCDEQQKLFVGAKIENRESKNSTRCHVGHMCILVFLIEQIYIYFFQ